MDGSHVRDGLDVKIYFTVQQNEIPAVSYGFTAGRKTYDHQRKSDKNINPTNTQNLAALQHMQVNGRARPPCIIVVSPVVIQYSVYFGYVNPLYLAVLAFSIFWGGYFLCPPPNAFNGKP